MKATTHRGSNSCTCAAGLSEHGMSWVVIYHRWVQRVRTSSVQRTVANTGHAQKNGAVSKVNKKFISHLTRAQRTPSAAGTVQVSHALPAVRFSCLLRGQFPRWRRSRKRLSVLRFEVSRSVNTVQREFRARFRKDAPWCVFPKPCTKLTLHCIHRSGHLKTEHRKPFPAATPSWKLAPQ